MSRYLKQDGNLIPLEKYNADNGLSTTSENAVQNKVVTQEILDTKADIESGLSGKSGKFELVSVHYSNPASISISAGQIYSSGLTANKDVTGMIRLGVVNFNTGNSDCRPYCIAGSILGIRNAGTKTATISAGNLQMDVMYLKWL